MEKYLSLLQEYALTAGLRLVGALLLVIAGFKLIGVLTRLLKEGAFWRHVDASARSFICSLFSFALKAVLLLTAAAILGVPMTSMVALLGSAGLAIGLSFQGSLSNFAGGLIILIFRPFRVGDYIEAASGAGTVQAVTVLYTTLLTVDGRRVIVPNGALSAGAVTNYSAEERRRVDMECAVSRDSDIEQVRGVLLDIAARHALILDEPAPLARVLRHGDFSLIFTFRVWCAAGDYWTVTFDLAEQVKQEFDRAGIRIPHPKMDVRMTDTAR